MSSMHKQTLLGAFATRELALLIQDNYVTYAPARLRHDDLRKHGIHGFGKHHGT